MNSKPAESDTTTVKVRILDRTYQMSCTRDEETALRESATHVDRKMREIRDSSSLLELERIAVMTALHIANDYIGQSRKLDNLVTGQDEDFNVLSVKLDQALSRLKSI